MEILGIFVKHPQPGKVKTRLAAEVGPEPAAQFYAAFMEDLMERFQQSGETRFLCYSPANENAQAYFQALAGDAFELWPQPELSLGERLSAFFDFAFSFAKKTNELPKVVVMGSDSPTLPGEIVEEAFRKLDTHDIVLGPATDGGYYLIGQKVMNRSVFKNISWSESRVLEQTISRISECQASLALLPLWYDVDTADDLQLLRGHLKALKHSGNNIHIPRVEKLL
ncbi:MAG: TIGR04282 family arsenosugar biosynthesis glycosyltransferase [Planctomycetaceae bacterium]